LSSRVLTLSFRCRLKLVQAYQKWQQEFVVACNFTADVVPSCSPSPLRVAPRSSWEVHLRRLLRTPRERLERCLHMDGVSCGSDLILALSPRLFPSARLKSRVLAFVSRTLFISAIFD
jgi:hypothetical protein